MSATPSPHLELDWRIRIWVLMPITIATILMGILRHCTARLLIRDPVIDLLKVRDASAIARASSARFSSSMVHRTQFEARRNHFSSLDGPLRKTNISSITPMAVLMNPENLSNQVTALLTNIVPQMILGTWARYLFGGFAVCRIPFPLSQRFRGMLQAGIERTGQSLDVTYVSAFSWYIVNLFGNTAIVQLCLSADAHVGPSENGNEVSVTGLVGKLSSEFQGFNSARDVQVSALQALDHTSALLGLERSLLDTNPCSVVPKI
jgi:ER membrane protein complex subunit 3